MTTDCALAGVTISGRNFFTRSRSGAVYLLNPHTAPMSKKYLIRITELERVISEFFTALVHFASLAVRIVGGTGGGTAKPGSNVSSRSITLIEPDFPRLARPQLPGLPGAGPPLCRSRFLSWRGCSSSLKMTVSYTQISPGKGVGGFVC